MVKMNNDREDLLWVAQDVLDEINMTPGGCPICKVDVGEHLKDYACAIFEQGVHDEIERLIKDNYDG